MDPHFIDGKGGNRYGYLLVVRMFHKQAAVPYIDAQRITHASHAVVVVHVDEH